MSQRQYLPTPATAGSDANGSGPSRHGRDGSHGGRTQASGVSGRFREQPILNSLLVLLCITAIVIAVTAIGPATASSGQTTRTATAKSGVVQSTVSGSGNVQSANELDLGFKTSGTVADIYVKQGQRVVKGQLLASLDPESTEVTLEQAKATLQSTEANLAQLEENEGESSSAQGSSGASASAASAASSSDTSYEASTSATPGSPSTNETASAPTGTTTEPATAPATTTTPTTNTKTTTSPAKGSSPSSSGSTPKSAEDESSASGGVSESRQSEATRDANLASARAAVKSDTLTVRSEEQAVENTKLRAPEDGTIVSLSGEVGQSVSASGTSKATQSAGSSSSSSGSTTAAAATTSSPSSSEGSSGSSTFMVLSNLESMQLVVSLSESEIGNVHVGQIATLTIEALSGRKVAAHVVNVDQTPTSTSGAVSYDVTFRLDQGATGLKVGMSATAEVVIKQAEGVNVPTSAVKANSVTVLHDGKQETRQVSTGLSGDTATIVSSGLKSGETVVLPSTSTSGSSSGTSPFGSKSSSRGSLGSALGGSGGFPSGGPPSGGSFPGGTP